MVYSTVRLFICLVCYICEVVVVSVLSDEVCRSTYSICYSVRLWHCAILLKSQYVTVFSVCVTSVRLWMCTALSAGEYVTIFIVRVTSVRLWWCAAM